jgi:ubiquinone/menaquinone biosynthesis C-methylase UbiE
MLAIAVRNYINNNGTNISVVEIDPNSPLKNYLKSTIKHYKRTHYFSAEKPVKMSVYDSQFEDITKLSFPNNSIDLIISSDVLEHVPEINLAISETLRVLRAGGAHIFTVPFAEKTKCRAQVKNEIIEYNEPPVFHLDPHNINGILVFWDIGFDILNHIKIKDATLSIIQGPEGPDSRIVWALTKLKL